MNTLWNFTITHLELWLRIVAVAQVALAVLSLNLPRILQWQPDIDRMSLLVRQVFEIHAWFIALTLMIWGALTWRFAPEMAHAPTELSRWLCAAIGIHQSGSRLYERKGPATLAPTKGPENPECESPAIIAGRASSVFSLTRVGARCNQEQESAHANPLPCLTGLSPIS